MTGETCGCGGSDDERLRDDDRPRDDVAAADRWIDERPVTDGRLPADLARLMTRFYGADRVETVGDFVAATRADAGGGAISVEQLCHVDGDSPHVARTSGETYRFRCFYDGVALSLLADEAVEIATETPTGTPLEVRVSPDGAVESDPEGAVLSFGIATDAVATGDGTPDADPPAGTPATGPTDGAPDPEDVYAAVCPYVKAFRTRDAYEGWAAAVDAATVGMPLEGGMPVARALTAEA